MRLPVLCIFAFLVLIGAARPVVFAQTPVTSVNAQVLPPAAPPDTTADPLAAGGVIIEKDIILVLDNSGSMRQNDPGFLAKRAVVEFIGGLDESTRVAVIIFDQYVNLAVPLADAGPTGRDDIIASLDRINYRGLFTDSPAAMERAIYELKNNGRVSAQKLIVFMTDGIVDTGDAEADLDRSKWLRESLAPDAADSGIRIFGIAFTEDADFQLIQSLAQQSGGEYYRALQPEDLSRVFDQINTIILKPPKAATIAEPQSAPATPPPPVIIEVPAQAAPAMGREERVRALIMLTAAAVLIVAVLAILILLLRRGRGAGAAAGESVTEAFLNDIHGYTSQTSYKLGTKPVMLGRVAGMDTEHLDYIVIPESTIGRRHSLIEYKDYAYWIVDQGSINGTFVNDAPITSEVRLKHGDKIRLHKYEFEFIMPEMADAGMTVVSQTMLSAQAPEPVEATDLRGAAPLTGTGTDLDFDLTGAAEQAPDAAAAAASSGVDSEDETLMPESESLAPAETAADVEPDLASDDETLMPASESEAKTPPRGTPVVERAPAPPPPDREGEDETLMPGNFNLPEEDATLRKDLTQKKSFDNFIDIGSLDDQNDKKT